MLRATFRTIGREVTILSGHRSGAVGRLYSILPDLIVEFANGEAWPYRATELEPARFSERVVFNHGFHDGASAARRYVGTATAARFLEAVDFVRRHFDPVYAIGYVYGLTAVEVDADTVESDQAWAIEQAARNRDGSLTARIERIARMFDVASAAWPTDAGKEA